MIEIGSLSTTTFTWDALFALLIQISDRLLINIVFITDVTSDNTVGVHPHSTTSPQNSRPSSPQDDDISVTASISPAPDDRPGAFTSVTRTRKPLQPLPPPSSLFHSALAAQLFLNSPLIPTPPAWLYSQLYGGYDWWLRPPAPQDDSSSTPEREDETGSASSGIGKKRPASPQWTDSGIRNRNKTLITSERRPVDVWRPYWEDSIFERLNICEWRIY